MKNDLGYTVTEVIDRLRGNYRIPVNDGAGPLDGRDEFERLFPTSPLALAAADIIESLVTNSNNGDYLFVSADYLTEVRDALEDLGACPDPNCQMSMCSKILPRTIEILVSRKERDQQNTVG